MPSINLLFKCKHRLGRAWSRTVAVSFYCFVLIYVCSFKIFSIHILHKGVSDSLSTGFPQRRHNPSHALTRIPTPRSSKVMSAPSVSPYFVLNSFGITILPRLSTFLIAKTPEKSKSAATEVVAPKNDNSNCRQTKTNTYPISLPESPRSSRFYRENINFLD